MSNQSHQQSAAMTARDQILDRISTALGPVNVTSNPDGDWKRIDREYIQSDPLSGPALIEHFEHRLTDYGAEIFHCAADGIQSAIRTALVRRQAQRLLIPTGFPAEWLAEDLFFTVDHDLSYDQLNSFDGVLTIATTAIAATGSIVLQHGPGQGRRALSLIPDYHLCVVFANQVVQTVPAAFAKLDASRPTTFISGPSATADIEMTRIKGVHGPRFLDVVLVG